MFKTFAFLVIKGLRYRPIRGWLTVLGITIGVMLVVMIISLSDGIRNSVNSNLESFGSNLLVIFPGKSSNPIANLIGNQRFKERDLLDLEKVDGVTYVVPVERGTFIAEFKGEQQSAMINGSPWDGMIQTFEEAQGVELSKGRWPKDEQSREIVLGASLATELFKNEIRVGDELIVKSKRLKIVGILSEIGNQLDDNTVYLSMQLFREITGSPAVAGSAMLRVDDDRNIELVAKEVEFELSKQEDVRDFTVLTPATSERIIGGVISIIELALISLSLISLVVGSVGIMNTMYTSVLERTKQIGVMKAIGASNDSILSLFLIEAGILGIIGGLIGIGLGVFFAFLIGFTAEQFGTAGLFSLESLDFLGMLSIMTVTLIVGILSGLLPARRAAKMEPAESLRYE